MHSFEVRQNPGLVRFESWTCRLLSCVTLDRLLDFSVPQVSDRYNDRANIYNTRLVGELSKVMVMMIIATTLNDLT